MNAPLLLAQALYLLSPLLAAAALSAAVLRFDLAPWARRPIDLGLAIGGVRLFGDGKTWRGLAVAVLGCIAAASVQRAIGDRAGRLAVVDYAAIDPILFGAAMGAGAILGELPNSFVKRRLGIAQGKTTTGPLAAVFYVWDQVDLLTGAWPLLLPWLRPDGALVAASFALVLILHPALSLAGWLLGARKTAR
mgnify:CR=1 FL=1